MCMCVYEIKQAVKSQVTTAFKKYSAKHISDNREGPVVSQCMAGCSVRERGLW